MKWFHRKRLIRLADKLEGKGPYAAVGPVPPHKFDMRYLYTAFRGCSDVMPSQYFNPRKCKTAACALGWARIDPWFFGLNSDQFEHLFAASSYGVERGRFAKAPKVAARLRETANKGTSTP